MKLIVTSFSMPQRHSAPGMVLTSNTALLCLYLIQPRFIFLSKLHQCLGSALSSQWTGHNAVVTAPWKMTHSNSVKFFISLDRSFILARSFITSDGFELVLKWMSEDLEIQFYIGSHSFLFNCNPLIIDRLLFFPVVAQHIVWSESESTNFPNYSLEFGWVMASNRQSSSDFQGVKKHLGQKLIWSFVFHIICQKTLQERYGERKHLGTSDGGYSFVH